MNNLNAEKKKMKAIICEKYGSADQVLELQEIDIPEPKDDEVLIRNYGSSINTGDIMARSGKAPKALFWGLRQLMGPMLRLAYFGLTKPKSKVPGSGFSGEIVSVGKKVSDWKVGDAVYGYSENFGALAQYLTVPSSIIAKKPSNLTFQEAAAVVGGATPALLAFRDLRQPQKGQKVLIIGASGGVGTFGIQIAKNVYGAEITAVCGPTNIEMVKEIGADHAINYRDTDYTKIDQKFPIIFDAIGANTPSRCKNILTDDGVFISNNPVNSPKTIWYMMTNGFRKKKLLSGTANEGSDNMETLREWVEAGKIKPVIDTIYPLSQTAEAHKHYETGHAKGRVVISIE
ncbi:MAG: NAD(P)-dependent alcohol dehydrogenase [Candidatus Heimdallarchaeota archaeon]|nr:NAD(P)-dependent alcohol dehydrogenase [Candidatus Heimdallarchaeota archaeon]